MEIMDIETVEREKVSRAEVVLEQTWRRRVAASEFLAKLAGEPVAGPPGRADWRTALFSALCAFLAIGTLSVIHYLPSGSEAASEYTAVLGSFGASAVLMFGVPMSQLAQPRNAIVGQLLSGTIGIAARVLVSEPMGTPVLALPLAISVSLFVMQVTQTVHPPAGGTCLIMVLSSSALNWGLMVPVLIGSFVLVLWALLLNNANPVYRYPRYWFVAKPRPESFRDW